MPYEQKVNILLIDDRPENLISLEASLDCLGENLIKACSGEEALKHVLLNDFAVILLDVKMPVMDGYETASFIRKRERSQYTPIIFLTAFDRDDLCVSKGYELGAVDYLFKPIVPEIIRSKVKVFTDLYRMRQETIQISERYLEEKKKVDEVVLLLEQQKVELTRSNEELQQFAYVASHDLQEPLRMISSFLQLLQERYKDKLDEDANRFITRAVDGAEKMKKMINDLLTYSRINTQRNPFEPVNCESVLDQVLAILAMAIKKNNAVITRDPLPVVYADESKLVLLFQNLIGNAIKYHGEEPPHVCITAKDNGKEWIFSIRDNGIGIEPDYFERIFKVFQRLHGQAEYEGTGIGLSICEKIVSHHDGNIWLESEPGMGTTFHFTIPKIEKEIS